MLDTIIAIALRFNSKSSPKLVIHVLGVVLTTLVTSSMKFKDPSLVPSLKCVAYGPILTLEHPLTRIW
jgi:urea transporter